MPHGKSCPQDCFSEGAMWRHLNSSPNVRKQQTLCPVILPFWTFSSVETSDSIRHGWLLVPTVSGCPHAHSAQSHLSHVPDPQNQGQLFQPAKFWGWDFIIKQQLSEPLVLYCWSWLWCESAMAPTSSCYDGWSIACGSIMKTAEDLEGMG